MIKWLLFLLLLMACAPTQDPPLWRKRHVYELIDTIQDERGTKLIFRSLDRSTTDTFLLYRSRDHYKYNKF